MTKQSLGFVELEWTCPFCSTRNSGRVKVCRSCGAAQPKDVEFHQAAEDKIVTDQEGLEMAQAGPDVHCPFCGTRNPAGAASCSRCGGDLTQGEKRQEGQVIGAKQSGPAEDIKCQFCGTLNSAENVKCKNCGAPLGKVERPKPQAAAPSVKINPVFLIVGALLILLICGAFAFFMLRGSRTATSVARVSDVSWTRSIVVLGLAPVTMSAWDDEIPQNAQVNSCRQEEKGRSAFATENSQQIRGTPYIVDQGTGFGEVVQDCEYIVYDNFCEYTVVQLRPVGMVDETGSDLSPLWPEARLQQDQQLGERSETYEITFDVGGESHVYQTGSVQEFLQFQPGSEWDLEINGFGNIVGIQPAP
jgi:hypothetical protein